MVVLFSLTLALGMLVDNAIVIVENVFRYMQQGVPRMEAAMKATGEVAWPVIGATATTLAAFFPMLFWPGIMGEFMHFLPVTLMVTLSASLFVALIINPALCSYFMGTPKSVRPDRPSSSEIKSLGEKPVAIQGFFLAVYTRILKHALSHKLAVLAGAVVVTVLLFQFWMLTIGIEKPVEFFPSIEPRSVFVNIDVPEGADLEFIDDTVKQVEMAVACGSAESYEAAMAPQIHETARQRKFTAPSNINNVEHIYARVVENSGGSSVFESNLPNHIGVQFLDFEDRKTPTKADLEEIRRRVAQIPGVKITVEEQEEGPPTGAPSTSRLPGIVLRC